MRNGMVLIELILAIVIASIIASIAVPTISSVSDAAAVRGEVFRVVAALDATRGAAVRLNAVASLTLSSTNYRAIVVSGTDTIVALAQSGPTVNGVSLGGAGQPLLFGPAGLAMGVSNRTITLSRGSAVRKVVVSKLGRVTY